MPDVDEVIARVHRDEWARVVATIARRFGDLDIAEDAAAEAFATAVERWPADGVPPNPGGWLTTTAGNKALDRVRREGKRDDKHRQALMIDDDAPPEPLGAIDDDRLRMLFTCAHPALAMEARVALTLRMVGGLTVAEIAHAFLVQETTMAQRITRAKAKIKAAGIPYRVPAPPTCRRASRACWPCSTSSSTRATSRPARTPTPSAPTSPPRRSGSPAWCASCCPTTARSSGCSR